MDFYVKQKSKAKLLKINDIMCICLATLKFCFNYICSQIYPHISQYINLFEQFSCFQTTKCATKELYINNLTKVEKISKLLI